MAKKNSKGQGRGWHGDSAGHAKAGRKGGKARAKNQQEIGSNNSEMEEMEAEW